MLQLLLSILQIINLRLGLLGDVINIIIQFNFISTPGIFTNKIEVCLQVKAK